MQLDVQLEFAEGKTLACVEDSAGIFGSILENLTADEQLFYATRTNRSKPFTSREMPELIGHLESLIPFASGPTGRRHMEQIMELAVRCRRDRSMQLCFLPGTTQNVET